MRPGYNNNHSFGFIRFWIVLSSIFGIIGIIFAGGIYFYYLSKYNNGSFDAKNANMFLMNSYSDLASYKVLILLIVIFTFCATIICNIGLINYAIRSTDSELAANKWVLAVLSLSIGGFLTPFSLTWLPDTNVQATKNARVVLVRYLGTAGLAGAFFSFIALLSFYGNASIKQWSGNNENIFLTVVIVTAIITFISLIFVVPFYSHKVESYFAADSNKSTYYRFVATIYTVIATILLIFQIITCIIKVLEALARIFERGQNGFDIFFAITNLLLTLVSVGFMIYLITKVIKGLWKNDDGYRINIPKYKQEENLSYNS